MPELKLEDYVDPGWVYHSDCVEAFKIFPDSHATVKPVALMRWLCRLVTPPAGAILDPFAGSGSTGIAARLEGFRFVGFDLDVHCVDISNKRLAAEVEE